MKYFYSYYDYDDDGVYSRVIVVKGDVFNKKKHRKKISLQQKVKNRKQIN